MCGNIILFYVCRSAGHGAGDGAMRRGGGCSGIRRAPVRPSDIIQQYNRILLDVSMIVFGIIIIVTRPRDRISRVFYYKRFVLCSYIIITLHDEASVSWAYTRCRTSFRSAVGGGFCV